MATLLDLSHKADDLRKRLSLDAADKKVDAALAILTNLVENTPCDTGLHISNWRIGIGQPVQGVFLPFAPGRDGSTRQENIRAAIAVARHVLASVQPGQAVFISNGAPAIVMLNAGRSDQAPAGFVERALLISSQAKRVRTQ